MSHRLPAARFESAPAFYKWLERIALNDLRDAQRAANSKKRDPRRIARSDARTSLIELVQRVAAADRTPSRQLARDEATAAAVSCLARLTEEQRTVVQARYFDHESVADLAARLGKTESAIHALCYRALEELRRRLGSINRYLSSL